MYEVLVAHLRECAKLDKSNNTYAEAADAIEELQKRVPKRPHGRLIDADAVVAEIEEAIDNMEYSYPYLLREEQSQREHGMVFAEDIVRDALTIVPAEEG